MNRIKMILQNKIFASKLLLSVGLAFIVLISPSPVEAKLINKGEEFKATNGEILRINSFEEIEDQGPNGIFLGKYTIDNGRMRVVSNFFGTAVVTYYQITPIGLRNEKEGQFFFSIKKFKEQMINNCLEARKKTNNADCNCAKGKLEIDKATDKEILGEIARSTRVYIEKSKLTMESTANNWSPEELTRRLASISERDRIESADWSRTINKCGKM